MAINHGKLVFKRIEFEGRPYGMPVHVGSGKPWKDVAAEKESTWFIAVLEDGAILSCEPDPMQSLVVGPDIWEIEHPGPREAIFMKRWDGKNVVEKEP